MPSPDDEDASGEFRVERPIVPELEQGPRSPLAGQRRRSYANMQAVRPAAARAPAAPNGPRSYRTIEMIAIESPLSAGRELPAIDFDFDIDDDGALETDRLPSLQSTRKEQPRQLLEPPPSTRRSPQGRPIGVVRPSPRETAAQAQPPASPPTNGARRSSGSMEAVDPHDAIVAFAGFGVPPESLWDTPSHALRVLRRRRALRQDLAIAKGHRSPDVRLYEAALRTVDAGAIRKGLVVMAVEIVLALLFCVAAVEALAALLAVPR